MASQDEHRRFSTSFESIVPWLFVCTEFAFQLLMRVYGYHRDELYYLAIGDSWSFSNLYMPPVSPLYL